ncbi:MAG: hydroxyacylglutathione hydrolase C-terminal domain-containing protein, partial [Pseudomonadota bacterium]
ADNIPTVPTTVGLERATNPFLRAGDPILRAGMGMDDATDVDVFAEVRRRKDQF